MSSLIVKKLCMISFVKENKLIIVLISSYFLIFATLSCLRHYTFQTQTWDLAAFEQSFYNTIRGQFMFNNFESTSHFAVHFSPILLLLVPLYALWQSPYNLLIIQSLALALAALPLYLWTKKLINQKWAATIALLYLVYPSIHWINLFDFHAVPFAIPLIFSAFYFLEIDNKKMAILFLVLTALVEENMIVAVFFIGLYWFLTKNKKFGAGIALASLLYFIVVAKLIMPAFGGGIVRLDRYAQFGSTASEIIINVISKPSLTLTTILTGSKGLYLIKILLPVMFLPLFAGASLILLLPGLLINLLTTFELQFVNFYQYDSILVPFIFIGTALGLKWLTGKRLPDQKLTVLILLFAAIGFFWNSPISPINFPLNKFTYPRSESFRQILKLIPADVSVAAHTNLVPHLTHRSNIYLTGAEPLLADYVIIDGEDVFGFPDQASFDNYLESYRQTGQYEILLINDRYFIFKRHGL